MELKDFNTFGGYNPSKLKWDETITFPSTRRLLEFGNRVYNRYPARSIFLVPRATIHYKKKGKKTINVLDPFMGSGTTAVESSVQNCNIYGTEMDPFARLIAEVSIFRFDKKELKKIDAIYNDIINNWKNFPIDKKLYPNLNNIEYWFDETIFTDLLRLKSYLYHKIKNEKIFKFFQVTFADCIKPSSKMERQSTKPYISRKFKKEVKPVIESFEYSFKAHLKAISQYNTDHESIKSSSKINWLGTDATNFNTVKDIIDVAITSPPYLNAFDYTQIIKVESAWLGTLVNSDIDTLRHKQVGHEKRRDNSVNPLVSEIFKLYYGKIIKMSGSLEAKKSKTNYKNVANTCLSYFNDMYNNLVCVKAVLKRGGEYHLVIGDNVIKNIEIPTHKLIAEIAQSIGFKWVGYYKYAIKDHRTSIPRNENGGKIKHEYVIILKK
jgi:DNA modification methylase